MGSPIARRNRHSWVNWAVVLASNNDRGFGNRRDGRQSSKVIITSESHLGI